MIIIFLIALILYAIAIHIARSTYSYTSEDYEQVKEYEWSRSYITRLKENAEPSSRLQIPVWIWLITIVCFFFPIINIIAGVVAIVVIVMYILDEDHNATYKPGKIISFLTKKI